MYPLDDDNLDRISREAAEHFEVEASASGWDHLEKRLNKELPQDKKRRRFLFWLFLITATTGGALTGILKYQPVTPLEKNVTSAVTQVDNATPLPDNHTGNTRTPNATQNDAVSPNNETPETTAPVTDKLPVDNHQQSIAATSSSKPGIQTSKPATNQAASTTTATVPTKPFTQPVEKTPGRTVSKKNRVRIQKAPATLNYAVLAPLASANRQAYIPGKQKGKRRSDITSNQNNQQVPTASANNTTTFETDNRLTNVDPVTTGLPVDADNKVATTPPAVATTADSAKNKTAATPAVDSTKTMAKQPKRKGEKIQQPLEFGVIAGPDMSAVAFGPLYKPGFNFGVQVGYRFSDRWSVNAGLIYTKKFYKTDSSHFEYKGNPWPPNKTVSSVEGNCSMWDIPVNVRYDFSINDKRRWFASTGLSTYLMTKEDYDVYYRWNGGPTYGQPWPGDSNSTYPFSIWNLSVGMERSLGKRFALQAEPYLKIPLTDLGMGNMRMNSYGVLFILKYKPILHSKKDQTKNK
ncbi:hypothetical protein A4H97_26210 [Niastella yeongjuensis]|uniref:Outer membrane protein beta-barrel domain-containing protein n=1 Tax=Niastella yeongjuensis TaxID=354355 RepID=A0A1V9F156_9BACT|nr:porin family protein [Niastella yeongjuensis]OQP52109.1 hypothetical protein A4H97_26210 [Niastella yeongjuensis]SEP37508.1 Outer membrane protein beta-barrel domain-containing protein [Niastella yeongjuensis]